MGQENPLEESMATHSCILVWRIPWTEKSDRLQSMGSESAMTKVTYMHAWLIYVNLTGSQGVQIFDFTLFSGFSLMFPEETNI